MKRSSKKSRVPSAGKRKRASSRPQVEKSCTGKQLRKSRGKKSSDQNGRLDFQDFPVSRRTDPQVATACRHSFGIYLAQIDLRFSRARRGLAHAQDEGTSSTDPLMNVFRRHLAQLKSKPQDVHTTSLRVEMIDLAVKQFFLAERTFLLRDLISALVPPCSEPALKATYHSLVQGGRILTSHTGLAGRGESPFAFDLHADEAFQRSSNLSSLLEAFDDTSPRAGLLSTIHQAVRVIADLPASASRVEIRHAAKEMSDRFYFSLPSALRNRCGTSHINKKTGQNLQSALRHLLIWGLKEHRFALFFPEYRPTDAWNAMVDECFPLVLVGATPRGVLATRCAFTTIADILRDDVGVVHPADTTPAHIADAMRILSQPDRQGAQTRVRNLPSMRSSCSGNWHHAVVRLIVDTLEAPRKAPALPYLTSPGVPERVPNSLDGFCRIVRANGLPASWEEFFRWYWEYSTLPHLELRRRRDEFPARASKRLLGEVAFTARVSVTRALLGLARVLLPSQFMTLTPELVFGAQFESLILGMMDRWESQSNEGGRPSHGASAGLVHHVLAAGLISRALFDRSRHRQSRCIRPTVGAPSTRGKATPATVGGLMLAGNLSDNEIALLSAFEMSRLDASELQRRRADSPNGTGLNTVKDLTQLIRDTPFINFQRAQLWMLEHLSTMKSANLVHTLEYAAWTVVAMTHGLLISGGCRRGELCHLRGGVQTNLLSGDRVVTLRPVDRKNKRKLTFRVRDRWIPDSLIETYMLDVRPRLLAKAALTDDEFQFLLLNPRTGRPYGCTEEVVGDGTGRLLRPMLGRRGELARMWKRYVARAFRACDFPIPSGPQRFGLHVVRNVGGHAVYLRHGLTAAAAWLGDRVATIEGVYASLDGEQVDTSLVD